MRRKIGKTPVFIGLAAIEAYRFYTGKGIFNSVRFKRQHDAVAAYIDAHYPRAFYSGICKTESGWSCIVTTPSGRLVLHLTETSDGTFVFWEKRI